MPADLALTDLQGRAVTPESLQRQWLLVVVSAAACDTRCERHLWLQRQLHESLGREKTRVDKLWLIDDAGSPRPETLEAIVATGRQTAFAPATALRVPRSELAAFAAAAPARDRDQLYLVEPRGDARSTPKSTRTAESATSTGVRAAVAGTTPAMSPMWSWSRSTASSASAGAALGRCCGSGAAMDAPAGAAACPGIAHAIPLLRPGAARPSRASADRVSAPDWTGLWPASPIGASAHKPRGAEVPTRREARQGLVEMAHLSATAIGCDPRTSVAAWIAAGRIARARATWASSPW